MGESLKAFDALLLAGVTVVLGTGFVVGAMLALLSGDATTPFVIANSVPVATVVGVMLLLVAGALGTEQRWARYLGIVSFGAVVLFGFPSLSDPTVLQIVQTLLSGLATAYLIVRNPISKTDRTSVDESTSATKVGSTIR